MQKFKQLNLAQRYQIEVLLRAGHAQTDIANILKVHKSTISRELSRNIAARGRTAGKYVAENAQRKTTIRHTYKSKYIKFTDELKQEILPLLCHDKWSPELISETLKREGKSWLSHETIYKWIWQAKKSKHRSYSSYTELYKELKHGKRRQKRGNRKDNRGVILNRTPISERPQIVNERKRIGDIEVDLMMGKNHKSALLVMTDRTTLVTMIEKLSGKQADEVFSKIKKRLSNFNTAWIKTITFDNGKEFAGHLEIAELFNTKTYFTRPYTSQDKGTVENKIGVIRRFFPKKTDLREVSETRIKEVERLINNRPIRKFNYISPLQMLRNRCVAFMS
jgi:IS30 family transposase